MQTHPRASASACTLCVSYATDTVTDIQARCMNPVHTRSCGKVTLNMHITSSEMWRHHIQHVVESIHVVSPSTPLVLRPLWVCGVPLRGAGHRRHAAGQGRSVWQACECRQAQGVCRAPRRRCSSAQAGPHTDVQWGRSRGAHAWRGSAWVRAHAQHAWGADCPPARQHIHVPPAGTPPAHRPCWAIPAADAEQPADGCHDMGRPGEAGGWCCAAIASCCGLSSCAHQLLSDLMRNEFLWM